MVRVKGGMSLRNDTLHDLWKGIIMHDVISAEWLKEFAIPQVMPHAILQTHSALTPAHWRRKQSVWLKLRDFVACVM